MDGRPASVILITEKSSGDRGVLPLRDAGHAAHRLVPLRRRIRSCDSSASHLPLAIAAVPASAIAQKAPGPTGQREPAGLRIRGRPSTPEPGGEAKAVTQAILEEIDKHSELMANIEYLCDMIGPRLTGSPELKKANNWTRDKFRQYGLANAHLEPWTIERSWTRGEAKGRIVVPVGGGPCWNRPAGARDQGAGARAGGPRRGGSTDELSAYKGNSRGPGS